MDSRHVWYQQFSVDRLRLNGCPEQHLCREGFRNAFHLWMDLTALVQPVEPPSGKQCWSGSVLRKILQLGDCVPNDRIAIATRNS